MPIQAKVYSIVVTYNGARWIEKCLSYLFSGTYNTKVIIVDNCSTDNTVALLEPYLKKIIFFQSTENLGFGAANNIGIVEALKLGATHIFLVNQDVYVRKDCIESLVNTSMKFPQFGILSPMQLSTNGIDLELGFKAQISRTIKNIPDISFYNYQENSEIKMPLPVKFIAAATWFIPAYTIRKTGLFHPVFYHYGEDNNYASRVQYFKYKIGVLPDVAIIHDRDPRKKDEAFLLMKMRTFPLYMLLDIRKPFWVAYFLGLNQLSRYHKKLKKITGDKYDALYKEILNRFFVRINEAKQIRKETKSEPIFRKNAF
ncbi:MAG: glycosyltransferase family 2 protein [Bacteroidetes bacterium]|nr:glycosyltransferase family 2 protein [Bacteroidota bacterium]